MAVFNMVAVAVQVGGAAKLTKFDCFTLTLMKLRLNASNYDLGFRFNVSRQLAVSLLSGLKPWTFDCRSWSYGQTRKVFKRPCLFVFDHIMTLTSPQ